MEDHDDRQDEPRRRVMRRISMGRTGRVLLSVAFLACGVTGAWAADDPPLAIARDGFFYVGGKSVAINARPYMSGRKEVGIPLSPEQNQPLSLLVVHRRAPSRTHLTPKPKSTYNSPPT